MNLPHVFALLLALALVGCTTSDVIPSGPDTYTVTSAGAGFDTGGVRRHCYEKANAFCQKQGLVMMPVSINVKGGELGRHPPTAELVFRALKPGDPEIKRPSIERPDAIYRVQVR